MNKPYSVEWWGSHPDAGNDDCFVGEDYATKAEAFTDYEDVNGFPHTSAHSIAFVRMIMTAEEIRITRKNPDHDPARCAREAAADDKAWKQEIATQAGMGFGCDGYNDAMGY